MMMEVYKKNFSICFEKVVNFTALHTKKAVRGKNSNVRRLKQRISASIVILLL